MSFSYYMLAQSRRETVQEAYNAAAARLENALIKERLAEMNSQQDPLGNIVKDYFSGSLECLTLEEVANLREALYAAAHYAVLGRLPGVKP